MRDAGCEAHYSIDQLSVMGITDVLRSYRRLKGLQRTIGEHFLRLRPDVFIGVDVPDFVLPIEQMLKEADIRTVHFVSPTVWAWRQQRVHQVARSADLLLAIFPFEPEYYRVTDLRVAYVGHPFADEIPLEPRRDQAREALGLEPGKRYLALLPGSRGRELRRHVEPFLLAARECVRGLTELQILCAPIDANAAAMIERQRVTHAPDLRVTYCVGQARDVLAGADVALVASGTATLEALLSGCPQVVAYRTSWLDYALLRPLLRVSSIAMANILAGSRLVPEFVQTQMKAPAMAEAILDWLRKPQAVVDYRRRCDELHRVLRQDAMARAAEQVLELAGRR